LVCEGNFVENVYGKKVVVGSGKSEVCCTHPKWGNANLLKGGGPGAEERKEGSGRRGGGDWG